MKSLLLAILLAQDAGVPDVPPARQWSRPVELADGGQLPPGVFFPEPTYNKLDTELRRLQQVEAAQKNVGTMVLAGTVIGTVLGIIAGAVLGYVVGKR